MEPSAEFLGEVEVLPAVKGRRRWPDELKGRIVMPHPALDRPSRQRFMEPGDFAPFIEAFATHLYGLGHTGLTVDGYRAARHFAVWLDRSDIALDRVDANFAVHHCRCRGNRRCGRLSRKYVNRVRRFVHFLAATGSLILTEPDEAASTNALVTEFLDWQRRHRGLRERTIMHHSRMIERLLPELGEDPAAYNAGLIRRVVLAMARANTPVSTKAMALSQACGSTSLSFAVWMRDAMRS